MFRARHIIGSLSKLNARQIELNRTSQSWLSSQGQISKTCLYELHQRKGAKFEPFAGYQMPIVYAGQTIREEHLHTRNQASLFDVSHMMQTLVLGPSRDDFIETLTVSDLKNLAPGKCVLSVYTNSNGGIIDDCIISNCGDHLFIVSNAGNANTVWSWLNQKRQEYIKNNSLSDTHLNIERLSSHALIALQGPKACKALQQLVGTDLFNLGFMETMTEMVDKVGRCRITRCGYTGEDGFEVSVESEKGIHLAELLLNIEPVKLAGLGSRDTLRLEAGLCLHGNDITDKISPVEAALTWTIQKRRRAKDDSPQFLGANIILDQIKQGTSMKRIGLMAKSTGPPARKGATVKDRDNKDIGYVTSGTYSPSLGVNIAMAYIPTTLSKDIGQILSCDVRGKAFEYEITKMPFVKSNYYFKTKAK